MKAARGIGSRWQVPERTVKILKPRLAQQQDVATPAPPRYVRSYAETPLTDADSDAAWSPGAVVRGPRARETLSLASSAKERNREGAAF